MKNEFSEIMQEQIDFYEANYTLASLHLNFNHKIYLGYKNN